MEILSPKSANVLVKSREVMKQPSKETRPKPNDKPVNPDKIDDKWRPPITVTEPGEAAEVYTTGRKLGKGGFAVCFEGRTQSTGEVLALKVVKAHIQQKKMLEKFRTEMQIHAKMRHPNIVEFMRAFTVEGHTYVVLELCDNGSLADMVKSRSCLSLPEVRRYMIQICGGVKYIHKRNVIHRDLKMGNVFIDSRMNLKIGDFGLAAVMADEQDRRTTLCGTPNYIAPEILSKSGVRGHDCKVDTWAIGIICYAMLTGRPPFQSSTQQEIYNKLRTLEYEWKIDSVNYIPQEAKECVASCLNLTAAERPDMDELVEQSFFRMGCIAEELDVSCLKKDPSWLEIADPRGDRTIQGYGMEHTKLCTECGVGKTQDGRLRPAIGGNAKISALVEIEVENRQGCAPTTPLPEGVLYKQFREAQAEWLSTQKHPLSMRPRSRKPIEEPTMPAGLVAKVAEDMRNDRPAPGKMLPPSSLPAPRAVQSFAAQQRQQALPKAQSARPAIVKKEETTSQSTTSAEEITTEMQGLLKAKPMRARSVRSTRATKARDDNEVKSSTVTVNIDKFSQRLMQDTEEADSRDLPKTTSTLPSRSRSLKSKLTAGSRSPAKDSVKLDVTRSEQHRTIAARSRAGSKRIVPSLEDVQGAESKTVSSEFELPKHKSAFRPRLIDVADPYCLVPGSSHAKVMKSLRELHSALGQSTLRSGRTPFISLLPSSYPRVDKWVDYATKHGIAYILTDGSLGMILKSKEADGTASSCIVVRNARRHTILRARGLEHQFVPQGANATDVEFYEQVDAAFAMKRFDVASSVFELDLQSHSSQTAAATTLLNKFRGSGAHRVKEVGLLDKFGKYMNKQMGASDMNEPEYTSKTPNTFIHFFQRMGNVGVWRFADGGLQFNFPDHTKLVLYSKPDTTVLFSTSSHGVVATGHTTDSNSSSSNEILVDVVHLEAKDAIDLSTNMVLTNDGLERRGLRTYTLSSILCSSSSTSSFSSQTASSSTSQLGRSDLEILESNQVREKLLWIRAVVGIWIKEGGLGRTGEEKLGWTGLTEVRSDRKTKVQWLTVGRPGGDGDGDGDQVVQ